MIITAANIFSRLKSQNVLNVKGEIIFSLAGINFSLECKDIIGIVLQEWFEQWMKKNEIFFRHAIHSQHWPDFILEDCQLLEVKAFDYTKSPNFDIANFDAYTRSLLDFPERLDADYLVFGYTVHGKTLSVTDIWLKKVWELTGPTKYPLNLQVKQDIATNIRPKNWRSKKVKIFNSVQEFLTALELTLDKFRPGQYESYALAVSKKYAQKTGKIL